MSPQKIEMYFTEIMQLSEQLCNLAIALKEKAQEELMQVVCENKSCWNSACEDILSGKEAGISTRIVAEADTLLVISGEMEEQAKKMYQIEMLNCQLAATRIYL